MPPPEERGAAEAGASDVGRALAALEGALPPAAIGVVLGSGLDAFVARVEPRASVPYAEIAGFPTCRVPGHAGVLHAGRIAHRDVVVFEGRFHLYEGRSVAEVAFPVRLLRAIGARAVLLTAAAGAVNPDYAPGDLVLVRDQINLTGEDPMRALVGGGALPVFPDLVRLYHPDLLERVTTLAFGLGRKYHRGVLAGVRGPSYETPAEARALRALGADLVCMSTVLEAMAAAQLGLPVLGFAIVTNAAGDERGTSHEHVLAEARKAGEGLAKFLATAIEEIDWTVRG